MRGESKVTVTFISAAKTFNLSVHQWFLSNWKCRAVTCWQFWELGAECDGKRRNGSTDEELSCWDVCSPGLLLILVWRQDGGSVILDPLCPLPVGVRGQRRKQNESRGGEVTGTRLETRRSSARSCWWSMWTKRR